MLEKENKNSKNSVGPKWIRAGTHSTYELANDEREVLKNDETLQVKVRRRQADNNYTVHFRKDPSAVPEKKKKERAPKKKRSKRQP